ncbi:GerAB/ArcD/ProY family transporter [Paenibacillus sp. 1P07SE]|uniref:GerAB/ArcD/ProY family transporter n=1 Tax=Paenibacillus sp. 1P07SE TaxID=3132209 RepID=UPI0039A57DEE
MNTKPLLPKQTALLLLVFLTGSSIINIPAPLTGIAGNAAWISILLSGSFGILLLACILYMHSKYPDLTLFGFSRMLLGKPLTLLLAIPYLCYLLVMTTFITIDAGAFIKDTLLIETPSYIILGLLLMLCAVTCRAGIDAMARMFTLLLYSMLFFVVLVLLLAIPSYTPGHLLPVVADGVLPIVHGTYYTIGFPYGEIIAFLFLLPLTRKETGDPLRRLMLRAISINILSLLCVIIASIMAVGPLSSELKYSVFQIARLISLQDILERVESVVAISLIGGSYMKASIALYVLNQGLSELLKLKNPQMLIYPLALVSFLLTLVMIDLSMDLPQKVTVVWPYYTFLAGIIPLLLLLLLVRIRSVGGT